MGSLMQTIKWTVLIMAIFSLGGCFSDNNTVLHANGIVPIYKTPEDAMPSSHEGTISELYAQQQVEVEKFVDVKHYQIYRVRLPGGIVGYVNEGDYVLLRNDNESIR